MQKRIKSRFVWQWLGSFQTISQCSYLTVKNVQKSGTPKKVTCITFIGGNNFSKSILISYLRLYEITTYKWCPTFSTYCTRYIMKFVLNINMNAPSEMILPHCASLCKSEEIRQQDSIIMFVVRQTSWSLTCLCEFDKTYTYRRTMSWNPLLSYHTVILEYFKIKE